MSYALSSERCAYDPTCPDPMYRNGVCKHHYGRQQYLKSVGKTEEEANSWRQGQTLAEKLWAEVTKSPEGSNGCWRWTGRLAGQQKYGQVWHEGHYYYVHCVAYELLVGPIPDGCTLDHICHNAAAEAGLCDGGPECDHHRCTNPDHLEPKPLGDNVLSSPLTWAAINKAKTHCKRGHPFDEENTGYKKGTRHRFCRACQKMTPQQRAEWDRLHLASDAPGPRVEPRRVSEITTREWLDGLS